MGTVEALEVSMTISLIPAGIFWLMAVTTPAKNGAGPEVKYRASPMLMMFPMNSVTGNEMVVTEPATTTTELVPIPFNERNAVPAMIPPEFLTKAN